VHPIEALPVDVTPCNRDEKFFAADREQAAAIERILDAEPQSELALLREVSRTIPEYSRVYLGNSLPIREWDLAATRDSRGFTIEANRGANGIDGQLSTFFGQCDPSCMNVCVIGDLTAIYDSNAPWIVPQLDPAIDFQIVIINNGGGRIFSRVASLRKLAESIRERIIENSHDLRFEHWAAMWGMEYSVIANANDFASKPVRDAGFLPAGHAMAQLAKLPNRAPFSPTFFVGEKVPKADEGAFPNEAPNNAKRVIEIRPDRDATQRAWAKYDALW
jgi:hypothetical protein